MHTPRDPNFEQRVRGSFAKQAAMNTIGATLTGVAPGEVSIDLPFSTALTQQHGFLHAGVVTTIIDSACGYAALTLMEPGTAVLSIEFKVNLLAPARGSRFRATGTVVRAGRNVTVVTGECRAVGEGEDGAVIAIMTATMMTVRDRAGLAD
ncbi:MAG TPA: PaaI family thioesterase [Gemmatimonadaceae bacterium]|jgi:uncharacterized protein (TIGR00369 family)